MNRVGLVEDNLDFRHELAFSLSRAGFVVTFQSDGVDIDRLMAQNPCELIVLDLCLPAEDGIQIARRLRIQYPQLGIVMLTARNRLEDRLIGLQEGADAYLVKPVDMRELVGVMQSLQRRLVSSPASAWKLAQSELKIESPEGIVVELSAREHMILKTIAKNMPKPTSRKDLAEMLGFPGLDFDFRRIEVTISRLRKKLEIAKAGVNLLRSERSYGYVLAAQVSIVS